MLIGTTLLLKRRINEQEPVFFRFQGTIVRIEQVTLETTQETVLETPDLVVCYV